MISSRRPSHVSFTAPDWNESLDADALLASVPPGRTAKGMFLARTLADLRRRGLDLPGFGPYRAFKDYPLTESIRLGTTAAPMLYPDCSPREALRRLGWTAYGTFRSTVIGRVILGILGEGDLQGLVRIVPKAYAKVTHDGMVEVLETDPDHGIVRFQDWYNLADTYQVGVFEGVLREYELPGEVLIDRHSPTDVDVLIRWSKPGHPSPR